MKFQVPESSADCFTAEFHILGRTYPPHPLISLLHFSSSQDQENSFDEALKLLDAKDLKMDTEDNYNSGEMPLPQFPERFSSPFSVNHNRFGGVRHGFNTGSNRTHPYSHVPNLIPQPYRLHPIRSVPTDNDLNNRSQVSMLRI